MAANDPMSARDVAGPSRGKVAASQSSPMGKMGAGAKPAAAAAPGRATNELRWRPYGGPPPSDKPWIGKPVSVVAQVEA
jgi:hypothetical protein